jgi:hypothetical protein
MCPCDQATNRVCDSCATRIKDLHATREEYRNSRRATMAHRCTQALIEFGDWKVLAVTGEHASNAPAHQLRRTA